MDPMQAMRTLRDVNRASTTLVCGQAIRRDAIASPVGAPPEESVAVRTPEAPAAGGRQWPAEGTMAGRLPASARRAVAVPPSVSSRE
jgi:hypothetical protein